MTSLLVLAGGFGTRLRETVASVPKPLAPVLDKPYLHYLIDGWLDQGVTSMTFLLHHRADQIETFLQSIAVAGRLRGCELRTVVEPSPLGTGGAIAYAVRQLGLSGSFLTANSDTWLGSGIRQMGGTPPPAMGVVRVPDCSRFGSVAFDGNKIGAFNEKQTSGGPGWINAGLYHLDALLFRQWNGEKFSLEAELFPRLAKAGELTAVHLKTDFVDIGIPSDYFRFCRWVESGRLGPL